MTTSPPETGRPAASPPANRRTDVKHSRGSMRPPVDSRQTNNHTSNPKQTSGQTTSAALNRGSGAQATNLTKPKDEAPQMPILILGAQGCGKSSLINAAFGKPTRETSNGFDLATKEFEAISGLTAGKHSFVLVDSPGFDNASMSDGELTTKLIHFLCCGKTGSAPNMAGVIYVHPQGARLGSGVLKKNLHLIKSLLGDIFMDRLTILVVPRPGQKTDPNEIVRPLLDPKSPFYALYKSGARFDVSALETEPIRNLILAYGRKAPISMNVQTELGKSGRVTDTDISAYLVKCTRESGSVATRPKVAAAAALSHIRPPSNPRGSNEVKKLELELAVSKKEKEESSTQMQQYIEEYASLRSQLQINENIEQRDIVQNLLDLNRRIEDLAISSSQHLVDTYAGKNMITTKNAFELPGLKRLFEHEDGKASLVLSSTGVGMPLEDFLDVAIRSILCEQIYKRILAPFHPGLGFSDPRNIYISGMYSRIREKESQANRGRWRTTAFTAISEMIGESHLSHSRSKAGLEILNENLMPMLQCLFGPGKKAQLRDGHVKEISELTTQAWDWCVTLKEKVVLLGDFKPAAYRYGNAFDHTTMSEFEPRPGAQPAARILSTIGLGLNVLRPQSSAEGSDQVMLRKASVVTEGWFERP